MEEIDKIIIHSLRQIGCEIEDEITSIGQFSTDQVVEATARCLRIMKPGIEVPLSLPPSMSARYRVCGIFAETCVELGYKGDIGYQIFLYSTETDIRRVFMFLIEKLPKESEKVAAVPLDSSRRLKQQISERLRHQLSVPWLPPRCRLRGLQPLPDGSWVREGYASTLEFDTVPLSIPRQSSLEGGYCPPVVTDQIQDRSQLLPSLIAFNSERLANEDCPHSYQFTPETLQQLETHLNLSRALSSEKPKPAPRQRTAPSKETATPIPAARTNVPAEEKSLESNEIGEQISKEEQAENLQQEIAKLASKVDELQLSSRSLSAKASQAKNEAETAEAKIHSQEFKISLQKRALDLLPEAESNIAKLQALVEQSSQKLINLASQWERHRIPLVESYREAREKNSHRASESQRQAETLRSVKEKIREVSDDARVKDQLHSQLVAECEKLSKDVSRSAYTRRIMEIIGNIRKQKEEIDKVLADTRQVQKEINQLTGRLDRSFAVADELIFRDAKREEAARRAYKLLATLHADCAELVGLVQETGATMREIRDLEDQIETESAKNVSANLERITADLRQMKQESASLMAQIKSKS